ncbi:MAG: sugar phosphate nucleotidyltransferase [Candidatus Helarchaeota archaeon]
MRAVILAAGYGKRMGGLTKQLPKPLIPIVNKPVLVHILENLIRIGIKDCIIVVGHLKDQIVEFLMNYNPKKLEITIVESKEFKKGPIYSLAACIDIIRDEAFILLPADFIFDPSVLSEFIQRTKKHNLALTYTKRVEERPYTAIRLSNDLIRPRVLEIVAKQTDEKYQGNQLLPILICRINFKSYIEKSVDLGYTQVIDAVNLYIQQDNKVIGVQSHQGYWFDLDTIKDVLAANRYLLDQLQSEELHVNTHTFSDCNLFQPIIIGENCSLQKSCSIGPYVSIGNDTLIRENAQIQNSIICPSSQIPTNARIKDAIFFKTIFYEKNKMGH